MNFYEKIINSDLYKIYKNNDNNFRFIIHSDYDCEPFYYSLLMFKHQNNEVFCIKTLRTEKYVLDNNTATSIIKPIISKLLENKRYKFFIDIYFNILKNCKMCLRNNILKGSLYLDMSWFDIFEIVYKTNDPELYKYLLDKLNEIEYNFSVDPLADYNIKFLDFKYLVNMIQRVEYNHSILEKIELGQILFNDVSYSIFSSIIKLIYDQKGVEGLENFWQYVINTKDFEKNNHKDFNSPHIIANIYNKFVYNDVYNKDINFALINHPKKAFEIWTWLQNKIQEII